MKPVLLIITILLFYMVAKGQDTSFAAVVNKIHLNILTNHPDTSVATFLRRHIPMLAQEYEPGGWTSYPPGGPPPPPPEGFHSIKIGQHPYLQSAHLGARFDVQTQEWPEHGVGVVWIRILFYFNSKPEAEVALKELISQFTKVRATVETELTKTYTRYKLIKNLEESWSSMVLYLQKSVGKQGQYEILFGFGSDDGTPW